MEAFVLVSAAASGGSGTRGAAATRVCGRRAALGGVVAAGLAACVGEARADRTGKYSTKLTARRRYLPRINRGFEALEALEVKDGAVPEVTLDADDLVSAMRLFASSYFAEGNRIGATEKALAEISDSMAKHLAQLKKATNGDKAVDSLQLVLVDVRQYRSLSKLEEISVPN